ncbi:MAG: SDR family oxidoreductase [Congregibacter sp.]|nr:SDR family oxidoreductase [Congregibacter sp.]MDP5070183.1 SDR family oxidoreductase [Congregibacter sp.]
MQRPQHSFWHIAEARFLTRHAETPCFIESLKSHRVRAAHPLGRLGPAVEIADAGGFLASDQSIFITGSEWVLDGSSTAQ